MDKLCELLDKETHFLYSILKEHKPMTPLTREENQSFYEATTCHICTREFVDSNPKVRDHCHLTGQFRGAAHSKCNLSFRDCLMLPVVAHNAMGFDIHLFIRRLALQNEHMKLVAKTKEKYVFFEKHIIVDRIREKNVIMKLRFLDSLHFLNGSLDAIGKTLIDDQCVEIATRFGTGEHFKLMRQKLIFPYSYVNCFERLEETSLPPFDCFTNISLDDYRRAQRVWALFDCKTLGQYSDIYLTTDVLLLADIFENFRAFCLNTYQLDPLHYYTSPGLSWNAMLKYTGVEIQLLTDLDMTHFFRRGVRGGMTSCFRREATANNPFLQEYDSTRPTSYIMYVDATNLYGWALAQALPLNNFQWVHTPIDVMQVEDDASIGYILEVDLQIPVSLHDFFNDFPLLPETRCPPNSKHCKLMQTLYNKSFYIIHYRTLKQALQLGVILKAVHRVLSFNQSPWLKPYIELNTQLRNETTNDFHKGLFKLLINSIFGKTLENPEKRVDIKLLTHFERIGHRRGLQDYVSLPNFKSFTIFSENLAAVHMGRTSVFYNRPMFAGFSVLDISKIKMYEFFYGFLKKFNVKTLYSDTDSIIFEVADTNFYQVIRNNPHHFDTSNYPLENIHNIVPSQSVVGRFKDEMKGETIKRFLGAGPKTYCIQLENNSVTKKAKGVARATIENFLTLNHFERVVRGELDVVMANMYVFRSRHHEMFIELVRKVALSAKDDKRYQIPNSRDSLAWGHRNAPEDFS